MFRVHQESPAEAVEEAYFRIYRDRMADVPVHNDALSVEAVDFQKWQGHWLGVVVTSWCMSVLLVPGREEGWETPGDNERRFVKFPAGDFAFLGSVEPELGEFQSCALFSPMSRFASQAEAVMTARASLIALLTPVVQSEPEQKPQKAADEPSQSRRRFLALR
ncbi:Hydrogenase-2 operon protein HybE [Rhodocyclaceae bacterium]|nr:Hydrogenase-2 operon protein HybE [Rhodocyclaceae bacterium]